MATRARTSTLVQALTYHGLRAALIIGLLSTGFFTMLYWSYLVSLNLVTTIVGSSNITLEHAGSLTSATERASNDLAQGAITGLIVSAVIAGLLCALPRVRRHHKQLVITAVVVLGFCLILVVSATFVISGYLSAQATMQ